MRIKARGEQRTGVPQGMDRSDPGIAAAREATSLEHAVDPTTGRCHASPLTVSERSRRSLRATRLGGRRPYPDVPHATERRAFAATGLPTHADHRMAAVSAFRELGGSGARALQPPTHAVASLSTAISNRCHTAGDLRREAARLQRRRP